MSIADKFEVIADAVYDKGVSDGKKSEYESKIQKKNRDFFKEGVAK